MCGIFGIDGCDDAANLTYLGLYALQHRGQESTGMVSWDGRQLHLQLGMGHVSDVFKSFMLALEQVRGAYSLLLITDSCVIAARDPHGFRPLLLGDRQGCACFASESCAFDLLDAKMVRELEPGEVVVSRGGKVES